MKQNACSFNAGTPQQGSFLGLAPCLGYYQYMNNFATSVHFQKETTALLAKVASILTDKNFSVILDMTGIAHRGM